MSGISNRIKNETIWQDFYADGSKALRHPDENIVRLFSGDDPPIPKPPAKLLDHGFGSGNNALYFAKQGYHVYGVEVCNSAIDLAQSTFETAGLAGEFKLAQELNFTYPDEMFDIIVSWNCIHYNARIENVLHVGNELYRLLKPGGVIVLSTISVNHTLCKGAQDLGGGHFRVKEKHRFDQRGGLHLFVPLSKEHFLNVFAEGENRYRNVRYGWIDVNLFVPDKTLACHLLYGEK